MKSDNDECVIELAIKIPKGVYYAIKDGWYDENLRKMAIAIGNGVILPKGHGDLVDRSKIYKAIPAEEDNCTGMGMSYEEMDAYNDGIDAMCNLVRGAKTIIEADTAESEGKE